MKESSILPNTTQVPHIIIREWMKRLSDTELRVLLVVVDQTLGWIEDMETKRRKSEDWISASQLSYKTGKGSASITRAVKTLIEDHALIEAVDSKGRKLDTPEKRMKIGRGGKIFYRLSLHAPALSLFDKPRPSKAVKKPHQIDDASGKGHQKKDPQNDGLQKKPSYTKDSKTTQRPAEPSALVENPHRRFMAYWYDLVERTRGFKPTISPADARNLKRVLDLGIPVETLEQTALFFLADYDFKKFSPTLSTLLSAGILNGIRNRFIGGHDPEAWKKLTRYADLYLPKAPLTSGLPRPSFDPEDPEAPSRMVSMADAMGAILERMRSTATP